MSEGYQRHFGRRFSEIAVPDEISPMREKQPGIKLGGSVRVFPAAER